MMPSKSHGQLHDVTIHKIMPNQTSVDLIWLAYLNTFYLSAFANSFAQNLQQKKTERSAMEAQVTSCDGFVGRQPLLLISQLHGSSHCQFIVSNRLLNEYNRVSFLHVTLCYHKSTDIVTFSINSGVTSAQKYINTTRRWWNSTAIKRSANG